MDQTLLGPHDVSMDRYYSRLAAEGPLLRGSPEWAAREVARSALGAGCVNPYPIRKSQAHGEPDAHLQQIDTAEHLEKVRKEIAFRKEEAQK